MKVICIIPARGGSKSIKLKNIKLINRTPLIDYTIKNALRSKIFDHIVVSSDNKKIKTLKDFAELSSDELIGGYDEKKGVRFKIDGYLEEFALTKNEADDLIINARNIVFK